MNIELADTESWIQNNQPGFEAVAGIARQIGEQNQLDADLIESGAVTMGPFRDTVAAYLTKQQANTFRSLSEAQAAAPYAELADREQGLRAAMGGVAARLSSIEEQQKEKAALIHQEEQLVAKHIPELAPQLGEIAARLEREAATNARNDLEADQAALAKEYSMLSDFFVSAGQAWPIPRLTSPSSLVETSYGEQVTPERTAEIVEIDSFPEGKQELTNAEVATQVRRRHRDEVLTDASQFVALFLAEVPGRAYTLQDLAGIIYPDRQNNGSNCVSALISNFEAGAVTVIGRVLADCGGLVFQRGTRRTYYNNTAIAVGRGHPVFRAVPKDKAGVEERIVHATDAPGSLIANGQLIDEGWRAVTYSPDTDTTSDDAGATEAAEHETPAESPAPDSASAINESAALNDTPQAASRPTEPETAPEAIDSEPAQTQALTATRTTAENKPEPEWVQKLRESVLSTIAIFESTGLMIDGTINWRTIGIKSNSNIMGTQTMAKRAFSNGIISRDETDWKQSLPTFKFVCMALQNTSPEAFTTAKRRKQTLEMVERMVEAYFAQQRRNRP